MYTANANDLSITHGGLFYRLELFLKFINRNDPRVARRAVFLAAICWVPLFTLSALQGDAGNGPSSFIADIAAHARMLLAVPILIIAENIVDDRFAIIAAYFPNSNIIKENDIPAYEELLSSTLRMSDSAVSDIVIAILAYGILVLALLFADHPPEAWYAAETGGRGLTLAGWWYVMISMPLFYFLLLRWGWRLIIWCRYLWRLSRIDLNLIAAHPDQSAGITILSRSFEAFAPIFFAIAWVLSAAWCKQVLFGDAHVLDFKGPLIVFFVAALLISAGPLLLFMARLIRVKLRGLHDYGVLATRHSVFFDDKWIKGIDEHNEELLGTPDVSSMADLASGYQMVRAMRYVPFAPKSLIPLVVAIAGPHYSAYTNRDTPERSHKKSCGSSYVSLSNVRSKFYALSKILLTLSSNVCLIVLLHGVCRFSSYGVRLLRTEEKAAASNPGYQNT
jgi:hypothetical protein